jgi:hypothetical protein
MTEEELEAAKRCWKVCTSMGLTPEGIVEVLSLNMRLSLSEYAVVDDQLFDTKLFEIIREAKRCYTEDKHEYHGVWC